MAYTAKHGCKLDYPDQGIGTNATKSIAQRDTVVSLIIPIKGLELTAFPCLSANSLGCKLDYPDQGIGTARAQIPAAVHQREVVSLIIPIKGLELPC